MNFIDTKRRNQMTAKRAISSRRSGQRGFAIVVYALAIITIICFAGLAIDVGYMQYQKRRLQAAADAAAMGALRELELDGAGGSSVQTDMAAAGLNDASINGFVAQASGVAYHGVTVTIASPPTVGTFAGTNTAVMATVSKSIPTFFMQIVGQNSENLTATAVAQTSSTYGSVGGCIFALNPTASGALTVTGNSTISTACGAMVNSDSTSAFSMTGNGTFDLAIGAQVGVVGGYSIGGSSLLQMQGAGGYTNVLPLKVQSFNDPLANITAPTAASMAAAGYTYINQGMYTVLPNKTVNLSPGIYCGGFDFKGTVTFSPGIYVIAGGGLEIDSQANVGGTASSMTGGTNVMFYNTSSSSDSWGCTSSYGAGSFTFNGNAQIMLEATTSTDPVGVLFMDDRNISGLSHKILGSSTSTFDGALYFKQGHVDFQGTNKTPGFMYLVADTITVTGNSNLSNDKSDLTSVKTLAPTSTGGGLVF